MPLENFYTYTFLKTPTTCLELPQGIENPVQIVTVGDLSAIVEPDLWIESFQEDSDRLLQAVLSHDRVICEVFNQTPVLPLRFGTSFASLKGLQTHLVDCRQVYLEKLESFEGKGEYCIKFNPLTPPKQPDLPQGGGRQYFLAKKQYYQQQQDFWTLQASEWETVTQQVVQAYPESRIEPSQEGEGRIYLLISRQEEALLYENLRIWQQTCTLWNLQLGTALPPYHFAHL